MSNKYEFMNLINQAKSQARFDNISRFFKARKKSLLALFYVALAFMVFCFGLNIYSKSAQTKYSTIFHQALIEEEMGNTAKSVEKLEEIYEAKFAPSGVKGLASLRYAGILLNNGNSFKALEVYQKIATGRRYDQYIRELAGLLATKIMAIEVASSDKEKQQENLKQIEKFESKSKFLHDNIAEQKGIFLMKSGDLEKAYQTFEKISKSAESSQSLKTRALDLMKLTVSQGYEVKIVAETEAKK